MKAGVKVKQETATNYQQLILPLQTGMNHVQRFTEIIDSSSKLTFSSTWQQYLIWKFSSSWADVLFPPDDALNPWKTALMLFFILLTLHCFVVLVFMHLSIEWKLILKTMQRISTIYMLSWCIFWFKFDALQNSLACSLCWNFGPWFDDMSIHCCAACFWVHFRWSFLYATIVLFMNNLSAYWF